MTQLNTDRLPQLIDILLELPAESRASAAEAICGGDSRVLTLLLEAVSPEAQLSLESRIAGLPRPNSRPALTAAASSVVTDEPGDRIGPFQLMERLGEGGFGEVYAAEQRDPVRRRVALKIIKVGMDTRQVVARFEAERQALALMDHPNIAKVFDAGATAGGRPYFVMELIRGVPITQYCDENRLSPRERLRLMIPVCRAIQHAHQKGVIHRDIKPGNVLVTILDGEPVPKVIDFGVAKAVSTPLTDKTIYTQFRQMIGTPAYMSPEQFLLAGADVDTRSDVYALGVLLYELMAGVLPFETDTLLKEGLDQVQKIVRESDPPTPSAKVATLNAQQRSSIAQQRRLQPDRLGGSIRGEVDWMVMKAIDKDRSRRYQSASEFADDISRHLQGDPVSASPPSTAYRVRKLVRRHRGAFILGTAVVLGLLGTLTATIMGVYLEAKARRSAEDNERLANVQRTKAEGRAKVAEAALEFLPSILRGADFVNQGGRSDVTVAEMLDKVIKQLELGKDSDDTPLDPEIELQVRRSVAGIEAEIGRFQEADAQYKAALALATRLFGEDSLEVAGVLNGTAWVNWSLGRNNELEAGARRMLELVQLHDQEGTLLHAAALRNLELALHKQRRYGEALDVSLERVAIYERLNSASPALRARGFHEAVINAMNLGMVDDALRYSDAMMRYVKLAGAEDRMYRQLATRSWVLMTAGRIDEAETYARQAMEIADRLCGPDHPTPMYERLTLIRVLMAAGKIEEATARSKDLDALESRLKRPMTAEDADRQASILRRNGRQADALRIRLASKKFLAGPNALYRIDMPAVGGAFAEVCGIYADLGRPAEGIAELRPVYEAVLGKIRFDARNSYLRQMAAELIRAYEAVGDAASMTLASELRARYPGLEAARGFPAVTR